jgi:acyl-CoA synthetase (NDP forming)
MTLERRVDGRGVNMAPVTDDGASARPTDSVLLQAESEGRTVLMEHEVYALLSSAGVRVPVHRLIASPGLVDEDLCRRLASDQAVVKIVSPEVLHKSDIGAVVFCENSPGAIRDAVSRVLEAAAAHRATVRGALVTERVRFTPGLGHEMLAGFRHDPAFGPVLVVGIGGVDTEYLLSAVRPEGARVVASATDLTERRAVDLLRGTVVHAALTGALRSARGRGIPEASLVELVLALAELARRHAGFEPQDGLGLLELEVNPFVACEDGRVLALDGLARLHRRTRMAPARPIDRLRHLLTPRSAVVFGASARETNVGRVILRNLIAGAGVSRERIWAIHPSAATIDGCRAFPSPAELPEPADMAVVAVPANRGAGRIVTELVDSRRARTVMLIAGGFGETEAGREAEEEVRRTIEASHRSPDGGVLVNGGNCLGIVSVPGGYNTFFIPPYKLPFHDAPGQNVASISQSGAYLVAQVSNLDRAVRPRYAISFGNQVDVTVSDYLEYLESDREVRVFAVYLEGFRPGDGLRFLEIARRIAAGGRSVLLYKAGRSPAGSAAAASHTAAAVGDYDVCRQLVRAAGVIDCLTLNMLEDYLMTFSFLADRRATGRRIAVLSNAGFECAAAADRLYGLELATITPETRRRLAELLPVGIVDVHNPVDATPTTPTDRYADMVEALLDDPGVDAVVVAGVPATPYLEDLARGGDHGEDIGRETSLPSRLIRIFRSTSKPMVFSVDSGSLYEACVQMMKRAGLPSFRKVDRATRALAAFLGAYR